MRRWGLFAKQKVQHGAVWRGSSGPAREILAAVADVHRPRSFEDLVKYGFAD